MNFPNVIVQLPRRAGSARIAFECRATSAHSVTKVGGAIALPTPRAAPSTTVASLASFRDGAVVTLAISERVPARGQPTKPMH
jgi:hypothetical protein